MDYNNFLTEKQNIIFKQIVEEFGKIVNDFVSAMSNNFSFNQTIFHSCDIIISSKPKNWKKEGF